jgi:uncharacterized membrane-anchored protein YhcB (DUF1043 family)
MNGIEVWQVGIGVALFLAGLGAGFALRRGDAATKRRLQQLEAELAEARRLADAQQASVESHFEKTSDLFRDLTENYTALYSHLADGARTLCPEGGPALGRGLNNPLLEVEAGLATEAPAAPDSTSAVASAEPAAATADAPIDPTDLSDLPELEPLDDLEDLTRRVTDDPKLTLEKLDFEEELPEGVGVPDESEKAKAS